MPIKLFNLYGRHTMKKTAFLFVVVLMSVGVWAQADLTPRWLQTGTPQNGFVCCKHWDMLAIV
jgi:hypothetical protein